MVHSGPGGVIDHFAYTLDENGNRTSVTAGDGVETHGIDELNRLARVTSPDGTVTSYTYDPAGNRVTETTGGESTTYSYDSAGRITAVGSQPVSYDEAGNITGFGGDSFAYDWAERLVSATVDGESASYVYDGTGVRVAASHGAATASYVWDREAAWPLLVADTTSSFLHAGGLLGQADGGVPDYPLTDALGSIRARTDPAGAVTATTRYHPFGQPLDTGAAGLGFAGEQTDPTGLVFLRARYYHPELGRLLTPDPLQPNTAGTQGWNLYTYTANNPTTWTDPTGTLVIIEYSLQGAATGAAIGAAGGLLLCDDTALSDVSPADTYPACVFRTTLAGAAGAVTVPVAGLWATLGTGAAGGLASNLTYQATGILLGDHHFDPRALLTDTALATITAGTLPAGTRTWHNLRRLAPQTTLYRAVSTAEADDIARFGGFRAGPNSYEGKVFATSAEDAARYGRINDALTPGGLPFYIVEARVPTSLANSFERLTLDSMQAVHVAEGQLGAVNAAIRWRTWDWVPWVGKPGSGL